MAMYRNSLGGSVLFSVSPFFLGLRRKRRHLVVDSSRLMTPAPGARPSDGPVIAPMPEVVFVQVPASEVGTEEGEGAEGEALGEQQLEAEEEAGPEVEEEGRKLRSSVGA
jgi:hypothetical protein